MDWKNGAVSFSYFMDKNKTGNGYMTEALKELIKISFDMWFRRVQYSIDPKNEKSIGVAKRCGLIQQKGDGEFYLDLAQSQNFAHSGRIKNDKTI